MLADTIAAAIRMPFRAAWRVLRSLLVVALIPVALARRAYLLSDEMIEAAPRLGREPDDACAALDAERTARERLVWEGVLRATEREHSALDRAGIAVSKPRADAGARVEILVDRYLDQRLELEQARAAGALPSDVHDVLDEVLGQLENYDAELGGCSYAGHLSDQAELRATIGRVRALVVARGGAS